MTFEKKERVCITKNKNKNKDACVITNFLARKFFVPRNKNDLYLILRFNISSNYSFIYYIYPMSYNYILTIYI